MAGQAGHRARLRRTSVCGGSITAERALSQARHHRWRRRLNSRQVAERNQDVVGSYGRCHVPNNHSKYRTSCVLARGGTLVNRQRHHPGPGIQPPDSAAGAALYLRFLGGEKRPHRCISVLRSHTWQFHLPNRGLQPRRRSDGQVSGLDHVNSIRQGGVQRDPDLVRVAAGREPDLQVLSFAGRTCRCAAQVGDLRMRGKAG